MEIKVFEERKKKLIDFITDSFENGNISSDNKKSLEKLLGILKSYSFENRKEKKGTLTHTIIDSLEIDYFLGEKFIEFDNNIK